MRERSIAICVLGVVACASPHRDHDGSGSGTDGGNTTGDGANNNGCADGTELIYTFDQFTNGLSRFDPTTKAFTDLGTLSCPTMLGAGPFSMGVDRQANAWVLYDTGELFQVAILLNLACTKTSWHSSTNMKVFGMGFSTDAPGGSTEHLFIGGGPDQAQTSYTLAKVDPTSLVAQPIGSEPQLPEMTGNGKAELWGFFPDTSTPKVVMFDKTTGAAATTYPEPTLAGTMTAYAFAHWGGDYWVFLRKNSETFTTIYQVSGTTGAITSMTPAPGRTIVGAGVSTCAPVIIE